MATALLKVATCPRKITRFSAAARQGYAPAECESELTTNLVRPRPAYIRYLLSSRNKFDRILSAALFLRALVPTLSYVRSRASLCELSIDG